MSQSKKLLCDVHVDQSSTEWYGTLKVSNICYENGDPVTIENFLGVRFISPVPSSDPAFSSEPWFDFTPQVFAKTLDDSTVAVTARLLVSISHTFESANILDIEINGNLKDKPDFYEKSVELYADYLPEGIVDVNCAAAPDPALAGLKQKVVLEQDSPVSTLEADLGKITSFPAFSGTYKAVVDELTTLDQTVVAVPKVSPADFTVETNEHAGLEVTYSAVQKYSALEIQIGTLQSPIHGEELHVEVIEHDSKTALADFFSPDNRTTKFFRFPATGSVDVDAQITLNNTEYFAETSIHLSNEVLYVTLDQSAIKTQDVDVEGFVTLPIEVDGDLQSGRELFVRIKSIDDSNVAYTELVQATTGTQQFHVRVAPGHYTVYAPGFTDNATVYTIIAPTDLIVDQEGKSKLHLTTQRGANLKVNGFPDFLSFGGLTDLAETSEKDFTVARASSLFKYAGTNGDGNPNEYLDDDSATTTTIKLAKSVEDDIGGGHTVLPVMISYTCNLSLGDVPTQLANAEHHAHSFANLILSLNLAKNLAKENGKQECPCGYVINPDFLGECQKAKFGPDYKMPVIGPLNEALEHWSVSATVPEYIQDTLNGYVHGVNWLIRTVAPKVTFGWQVNLWGVGKSDWVYLPEKGSTDTDPADKALETATYIRSLDLYTSDSENKPDFLVVDRYEADDFTSRAYPNGYCYSPAEWNRFYSFCAHLSLDLQVPIMPWQIPASRIPNLQDSVSDLNTDHWGTGGTYLFGDENIGSSNANINPAVLSIPLNGALTRGAKTSGEVFDRAEPWDVSGPKYVDFPTRGIFTVLLGGGATTGIVQTIGKTGPWTQEQVSNYMNAPISFG